VRLLRSLLTFLFSLRKRPLTPLPAPLRSGVRFLLHKSNLSVTSNVFADMLETASNSTEGSELPTVDLEESSDVLEVVFAYFYPIRVPPWTLKLPGDLPFFRAFDKYEVCLRSPPPSLSCPGALHPDTVDPVAFHEQVVRGLEAVEAAFQ
jgi:hypothetical protein